MELEDIKKIIKNGGETLTKDLKKASLNNGYMVSLEGAESQVKSDDYNAIKKAIEENIRLLHEAEHQNCKDIDYVAGLTGKFLAELFVWKDDIWQDELRTMGFFMGKYIYLMDALEDVEQDKKNKNYNLFSEYGPVWGTEKEKEIHEILVAMMTEASRSFERLPILQNAEIIRNILYSGVWCKYVMIKERNSKQEKDKK